LNCKIGKDLNVRRNLSVQSLAVKSIDNLDKILKQTNGKNYISVIKTRIINMITFRNCMGTNGLYQTKGFGEATDFRYESSIEEMNWISYFNSLVKETKIITSLNMG